MKIHKILAFAIMEWFTNACNKGIYKAVSGKIEKEEDFIQAQDILRAFVYDYMRNMEKEFDISKEVLDNIVLKFDFIFIPNPKHAGDVILKICYDGIQDIGREKLQEKLLEDVEEIYGGDNNG